MNSLINLLCILNFVIAVISLPPCFMAGLMDLSDSPSPHKWYNTLFAYFVLGFPFISALCGILPKNNYLSFIVALFPTVVVIILLIFIKYLT